MLLLRAPHHRQRSKPQTISMQPNNNRQCHLFLITSTSKSYSPMSPSPQEIQHQSSTALDFALTVHPIRNDGPSPNEQTETPTDLPTAETPQSPIYKRAWNKCCKIYNANSFLILVIAAILLAYAYPPLGAIYLAPQITATWIAVMFIFILAGMGIKTEEFSKAFTRFYFNCFVQVFNFGVVSSIVYGFSRFMHSVGVLPQVSVFMVINELQLYLLYTHWDFLL